MKKTWIIPVVFTIIIIAMWTFVRAGASPQAPDHDVNIVDNNPADFDCTFLPINYSNSETINGDYIPGNEDPFCMRPTWTPEPEITIEAVTPTVTPAVTATATPDSDGKVTLCHKPDTPAEKTLRIPQPAVQGHLGHGDYIGECNDD